ncbi:MAG: hypothetical protein CM15mP49_14150 [Actinomycetota bacterium]|nr:MAG: hypothetical protein CM15mP49_14150 [Actinomycetota bacterium]
MTSEDQINKGLASNSVSASESQEELYPDSPTKISDATEAVRDKKTSTKQGSTLLSLPSRLRLPTILVHPFRTACSL